MRAILNHIRSARGSSPVVRDEIDFVNIIVTSSGPGSGPYHKTIEARSRERFDGIEYYVPQTDLETLLALLYSRHGQFLQLKITFESDVNSVSLRFSRDTLCAAGVTSIKLYADSNCTLSMDSRFCGKSIWDWVELKPHRHGNGQCNLVHNFKTHCLSKPVVPDAAPHSPHGVRSMAASQPANSHAPASTTSSQHYPTPTVAGSRSSQTTSGHHRSSRHSRDHTGRYLDAEQSPHYKSSRDRRRIRHGEDARQAHEAGRYHEARHAPGTHRSTVPRQQSTLRHTVQVDAPPAPVEAAPRDTFSGFAADLDNAIQDLTDPDPCWGGQPAVSHTMRDRFEPAENRGRAVIPPAVPDAPVSDNPVHYPPGSADSPATTQNFAAAAARRVRADDEWTESSAASLFEQFPYPTAASRRGGSTVSRGALHASQRSGLTSPFSRAPANVSTAASSFSRANSAFSGAPSAHLSSGPAGPAGFLGLGRHVEQFDNTNIDCYDMPTDPRASTTMPAVLLPFRR